MLLVSLKDAEKGRCLTKEPLNSLCATLDQFLPSLIIISNMRNSLEAYDYYYYPSRKEVASPVTFVKGEAFLLLEQEFLLEREIFANHSTNPFQTFYESGLFLFLRIFWIVAYSVILVASLWQIKHYTMNLGRPFLSVKGLLFSFSGLTCMSRIAFYSLGGDVSSLTKRILFELGFSIPLLSQVLFLILWLRVLESFFLFLNRWAIFFGLGLVFLAPFLYSISFGTRIASFLVPGQANLMTIIYVSTVEIGNGLVVLWLLWAIFKTSREMEKSTPLLPREDPLFKHFYRFASILLGWLMVRLCTIAVVRSLNKTSLASFQIRLWMEELVIAFLILFFLFSLSIPRTRKKPVFYEQEACYFQMLK